MCDVPIIAVFCSESIECFPGTASKFFLALLIIIIIIIITTTTNLHFPRIPVAALQLSVGICPTFVGMVRAGFPCIKSKKKI